MCQEIISEQINVGGEWRDFLRLPLYAVLVFSLVAVVIAYQWPGGADAQIDIGSQGDNAYLSDFFNAERNSDQAYPFDYRWSGSISTFTLPGVGRGVPLEITSYMAGRPAGSPLSEFTILANGAPVTTLEPTGYPPNPHIIQIPASVNKDDDLAITFTSNPFSPAGDNRQLGVLVDRIEVRQAGIEFVLPPIYPLAWLLFCLLLVYLTLRRLGVGRRATTLTVMGLGMFMAVALVTARYELTMFVQELGVVMVCVYVLALLLPPMVVWAMRRLRVEIGERELRLLMLICLLAFAVKAGGMMHPQFVDLDHLFRAHQVQELVSNPALFWDKYQHVTTADETGTIHSEQKHSMLGQWNVIVPFPYSPVGYFVLAPLEWLWSRGDDHKLVTASDTVLSALSCTMVFALFAIARKGLRSGRAGVIAGAIVGLAPITYLHFSDGAYPYVWAGWISVVYLTMAICLADRAGKPMPFALLSVLAALTILSHTAIAFFALAFVALTMLTLWVIRWRRWGLDIGNGVSLRPLLWSFLAGGVLSLVYYGGYVVPVLTVSLPALLERGSKAGVGLDEQYLGARLLNGFWPQLEAHFAMWPALLAIVGLILVGTTAAQASGRSTHGRRSNDYVFRIVTFAFLVAWAVTFLVFSAIDLKVNLLQRHMLFGLPLLALLAGYALAKLDWNASGPGRFRQAPLLTGLLVAYLFLVGWSLWVARALRYVLPPGSG